MCSGRGDGPLRPIRFPYSEIPGYVWLPTNRGLSQAPTSFFGSWCQGIHRVPLSTWQLQMMLASTVQFSRYGRSRALQRARRRRIRSWPRCGFRCRSRLRRGRSLRTQQRARPVRPPDPRSLLPMAAVLTGPAVTLGPNNQCSTSELANLKLVSKDTNLRHGSGRVGTVVRLRQVLLRKEVIQPHLPVRLPCYDFVPIAGPTFDGSLPCGLGHRLRVLPTFVT